jgi:hypothetical protein
LLQVDRQFGQGSLVGRPLVEERADRVQQSDRKGRRRAEPGAGRQVSKVVDLDPVIRAVGVEDRPDGRVLDLAGAVDQLDLRVDDPRAMLEERWQLPRRDVAVAVDREPDDGPAALAVPGLEVGAAAEQGDAERGASDDQLIPPSRTTA